MRYIKKYKKSENPSLIDEPEKGDYVICEEDTDNDDNFWLKDFLAKNIGQLVSDCQGGYYTVYYPTATAIDDQLIKNFFTREEIKYYSKNREELEIIIDANKYNL